MVRLAALLSLVLLAGCVTPAISNDPARSSVPPGIVLSLTDVGDAPNRVQDLFYTAVGERAFLRDIPFDPGLGGTVWMRGYLSTVASASGTLLVYVFDFDDRTTGQRLVRVGGQINSRASPGDPWEIVDYSLASEVADDVLAQFQDWANQNGVGL